MTKIAELEKFEEVEKQEPINVDLSKADFDLLKPWPYKAGSVDEIACLHVLNKIPGKLRGKFMDEAWRVLKDGGKLTVIAPYYSSMRAVADFDYEWPPLSEMSFLYFNKGWREINKSHLELKCDFDFTYGYSADPETATRSQDVQSFWIKHYSNAVIDLQLNLVKRKAE